MSHHRKIERISITIDMDLLDKLDRFVDLEKTANRDKSRASIISSLIKTHIPT